MRQDDNLSMYFGTFQLTPVHLESTLAFLKEEYTELLQEWDKLKAQAPSLQSYTHLQGSKLHYTQ